MLPASSLSCEDRLALAGVLEHQLFSALLAVHAAIPDRSRSVRGRSWSVLVIAAGPVLVIVRVGGQLRLDLLHVERLGLLDEIFERRGR